MRTNERESGQASVELVAAIPVVLGLLLVVAQLAVAGYALWTAAAAARAGARAELVGGDAERAARSAVPEALEAHASVREEPDGVEVTVPAPSLVPGLPRVSLHARARLDADG